MRNSIRFKFLVILSAFAGGIILFYIILNSIAFEKFYIINKKEVLVNTYKTINELYNEGADDIQLALERLDVNRSLNIVVMSNDSVIFNRAQGEFNRISLRVPRQNQMFPPFNPQNADILYDDGKCVITRRYDRFFQSFNIDLTAKLDNEYTLYIRSPMESITESVNITNRFILIIGAIVLFIGAFVVIFISKSFANPILKLSSIANEMTQLKFDVKYDVKGHDEISDLGNSINILSEKLEKTISELKTANTKLQKDIEIKTHIDEMRQEFLCNVSHELKTPISLIQGYAEGLAENIANDEDSKNFYCNVILDESMKMDQMVKKLLSLMQIESGHDPVTIRRFSITDLIKSLLVRNKRNFEQKGVNVIFNCDENVFVWGDEFLIEDVMNNFLSNALNHVDGDNIIEFKINTTENNARISVFNTGEHIPEDELDKIWGSFYKVDKARTRQYGGSGIGLAVVSAVMKSIGKPYGVENVDGGVEFYIELGMQ